jgi:Fungal protein kinase
LVWNAFHNECCPCSYGTLEGVLHISWYDHKGIITTNGFSLASHINHFIALLFIFQQFDRSNWGRCGDSNLRNDREMDGVKESIVSVDGKKFKFDPTNNNNVLRKSFAIGGQATGLYRCSGIGDQEMGYVIKFNWKEKSRLSEREVLEEIRKQVGATLMPPSSATSTAPNSLPSMKKSAHPLEWTVEQVLEWLRSHGCQRLLNSIQKLHQPASITSLLNPGAHSQKFAQWVCSQGSIGLLIANAIEDLHQLASITSLPNPVTHIHNIAGLSQDKDNDLLSYLPEIVAGVETDISTEPIRKDLGLESHPCQLVVIVFIELDGIIRELKGEEYWQVLWDCICCESALLHSLSSGLMCALGHKRLWKLRIHHHNISHGNLMYY